MAPLAVGGGVNKCRGGERRDGMVPEAVRAGADKLIVRTLIRQQLVYCHDRQAAQLATLQRLRDDAHSTSRALGGGQADAASSADVAKAISAGTASIALIEKDTPIERAMWIMAVAGGAAECAHAN